MSLYGVPSRLDSPTEPLSLAAIHDAVQQVEPATKSRWRRLRRIDWYMGGLAALAALVFGLLLVDEILPGDQSRPWIAYIVALCCIWTNVVILAKWRWDRRRGSKGESRMLDGQAQIRTQVALMRAEMMAQLGLLPEGVVSYGDRQATAVSLAALRRLAATGTDDSSRGFATVTPLRRGRDD